MYLLLVGCTIIMFPLNYHCCCFVLFVDIRELHEMLTVQACRGTEYDEGVDVTDAVVFSQAKTVLYRLPKEADFLYAYSTTPGTDILA